MDQQAARDQRTSITLETQAQGGSDVTVLGTEIDVQETDSSIYDWDPAEELTPQGYQQSLVPNAFTPAPPTGLSLLKAMPQRQSPRPPGSRTPFWSPGLRPLTDMF